MTPQELKNSILQLAIQGKLVEQRAEEGTGRELLEKILAAKNAKDAEKGKGRGRLTRSRGERGDAPTSAPSPLPGHPLRGQPSAGGYSSPRDEIPDDERPFDIPESWEWVHINQVADTSLGKTMDKVKNTGDFCPYLCSINVYWDGVSLEKIKEARFTVEDKQKYLLKKGDLLICEGGDVGRSAIWNLDKEMYYQNALHRVRFYDGVIPQYFRFLIECYKWLGIIERYCKGVTIKHLVQKSLYAIYFPLPPLAEQKRIVAKIEELMPLIDRYEKAWSRLESFNKSFPVDMQKSILQMAIQGKLVEQRAEEGTGRELLEKILAAKNAKDAEKGKGRGRLTRSRGERGDAPTSAPSPLPGHPLRGQPSAGGYSSPRDEIPDDEKPFEIPESWEWVRLGEVADINGGFAFKSTNYTSKGVRVIRISDFAETGFVNDKIVRYSYNETLKPYVLEEKNILLCMTGGTVGKSLFVSKMNEQMVVNQRVAMIKVRDAIPEYVYKVILAPTTQKVIQDSKNSTNDNISMDTIKCFLIPLPPLAEQKRIVAKLEELMPLCDRLK